NGHKVAEVVGIEEHPCRGHSFHLFLTQDAVLVGIQGLEEVRDELAPGRFQFPAVEPNLETDQHRPRFTTEDEDLAVVPWLFHVRRQQGSQRQCRQATNGQRTAETEPARERLHARISWMGRALGSTMRMGRPTLDMFCFLMSMPRARPMVPRK